MKVELVENIDLNTAILYLKSEESGALNFFIGSVRNQTQGKEVVKLVFEAYESMALTQLNKIVEQALEKWSLNKVIIQHVTGEKKPGELVVLIGVTSAHRDASFEACRFLIDELKKTVPIWKKEYYADNSIWVNAYP